MSPKSRAALRRVCRALPAALIAAAFLFGLSAAAPHSVHHLGQEAGQKVATCPAALAWATASGADCPAPVVGPGPSIEADVFTADVTLLSPIPPLALHQGRAPPLGILR
jgi:hypothetical protein